MPRPSQKLRDDALAIWKAGVDAVRPARLVPQVLKVGADRNGVEALSIGTLSIPLSAIGRIVVVGAGKAGAAMAAAVERALGESVCKAKQLSGWVNVPADCMPAADDADTVGYIHLHAGRPAGINEPTAAAIAGTEHILRLVESLATDDLCLCLLSGGGSALLAAPVAEISLEDKIKLTRFLSAAGANIQQLNTVRKQLSRVKGGGLARACRAGWLVSLIISDVIGDPLDVIASGPTVPNDTTARDALVILQEFGAIEASVAPTAVTYMERKVAAVSAVSTFQPISCLVSNLLIGNLTLAVAAAGLEAERRGYVTKTETATSPEGAAENVGLRLADWAINEQNDSEATCLVSGGEPTVVLVDPQRRGIGGRNQQLALAAGIRLADHDATGCAIFSGGTDG
ncbi:MAG: glycerate-2-kinase family protein, partial [Planctomycetia bacterium]|nr:glycerate-2-kinase family protein [Planctomycetia bacterium]